MPPLDIEDCTSLVLAKVCYKIVKFDKTRGNIKPFLNCIIKNLVFNYYKKAQHDPITINENGHYENTLENDYWQDRRDYEIAHCINSLPCDLLNIILLYYYDNLKEHEIADLIGVSQQTVSYRLNKALGILKPKIAKRLKELEDVRSEL